MKVQFVNLSGSVLNTYQFHLTYNNIIPFEIYNQDNSAIYYNAYIIMLVILII
jgi:hypothetical protein|uniref:Uncharacterized protein n=1 Tax=viral metagenome TaxID=1070528 RepID=A0A6C0EDP4_9ZZZZ